MNWITNLIVEHAALVILATSAIALSVGAVVFIGYLFIHEYFWRE